MMRTFNRTPSGRVRATWCVHPCVDPEVICSQGTCTISITFAVLTETTEAVAAVRIEEPEQISAAGTQGRCGVGCCYCGILVGNDELVGDPIQFVATAVDRRVVANGHTEGSSVRDLTHTRDHVLAVVDDAPSVGSCFHAGCSRAIHLQRCPSHAVGSSRPTGRVFGCRCCWREPGCCRLGWLWFRFHQGLRRSPGSGPCPLWNSRIRLLLLLVHGHRSSRSLRGAWMCAGHGVRVHAHVSSWIVIRPMLDAVVTPCPSGVRVTTQEVRIAQSVATPLHTVTVPSVPASGRSNGASRTVDQDRRRSDVRNRACIASVAKKRTLVLGRRIRRGSSRGYRSQGWSLITVNVAPGSK
jgi:hypothetical protein